MTKILGNDNQAIWVTRDNEGLQNSLSNIENTWALN